MAAPMLYRVGARDFVAIGGKDGRVTTVDRATKQRVFRTGAPPSDHAEGSAARRRAHVPGLCGWRGVEWPGPGSADTTS